MGFSALYAFCLQICDHCNNVIAHQIELGMPGVVIGWVNTHFGRRQRKDQPAVTRIDGCEAENITHEFSILLRIV